MYRPQIGISQSLDDRGRWREGRSYHYIDRAYADAIANAGGRALQLPIQPATTSLVSGLDGLLLPGGDDFPAATNSNTNAFLDLASPEQIAFDQALFAAACERGVPILGICYGMQLMALAGGGELDAHLPTERPDADCHKLSANARHAISIERTSLLAILLESEDVTVNSLHHQAVRSVGPMHRVVAKSPDGVIEAIEGLRGHDGDDAPYSGWEIGVQWHPEKMSDVSSERLFKAFVDACREHHASPPNNENAKEDALGNSPC